MKLLINSLNSIVAKIGRFSAWFSLLMVVITFAIVVLRYGFNLGWIAMQESVIYLHACLFMLGAAYALQKNEHVRVDIFYRNFSPQRKAWVNIAGTYLLLLPVCFYILATSWEYVMDSWALLESSPEAGGIPAVFLLKTLILLCAILLCLQGVAHSLRDLMFLKTGDQQWS